MITIPVSELPIVLRKPLVFGDREQIDALNALDEKVKKMVEDTERKLSGELKKFRVEVEYERSDTMTVWAVDEEHAVEVAEADGLGSEPDDIDTHFSAREVKVA